MKRKPIVGETLYDLNVGNAAREREQKLTPVQVTSVGRKYFKCKNVDTYFLETEYHIDTWRQRTDYSASHELYESEQQWHDQREAESINYYLATFFSTYGKPQATLEQLRAIKAILSAKQDKQ